MRLALIHGFTQTGASWAPVRDRLHSHHHVVCPDLPGHGAKGRVRATLPEAATILAEEVGPAIWVGYSLGGRVCLHVALAHPEVVHGLMLVSTTPGLADDAERAARRKEDEALADDIEREGVPAFVERWLAAPMWASLPRDQAGVDIRLSNTAAGLASSLRLAGTGTQEPLWDRLHEITAPILVVTGAKDEKFTAIGTRMTGEHATLDTGHAVPWEQPAAFTAALDQWVHRISPAASSPPKTS